MGYLIRKKKKEKIYIYVRESYRVKGVIKHKYIYSFGAMPAALDNLYNIANNKIPFPNELKKNDYVISDIMDWILTLETQSTKHGREFEL